MRKEDVVGISSLSFSNTGNGIYLSSSSELQQISLSARHTVAAGGGRVEVERRDEEEGGEGDTDSQADRWEYMKNQNTLYIYLLGKTVRTKGRQEEEERARERTEMRTRIMKPP